MDFGSTNPLFETPTEPARKDPGWSSRKIPAGKLEVLASHIIFFRDRGLTAQLAAKDYIYRLLAPLQDHKKDMWNLAQNDPMRLRVEDLDEAAIQGMMKILFADEKVPDLPRMLAPCTALRRHRGK